MTAKETLYDGTTWTDQRARYAFPILLQLAKTGEKFTYGKLDKEIAQQNNVKITPVVAGYGKVLEIVGQALNELSQEWNEEIPPLTILIVNVDSGMPSPGVDGFLRRYVSKSIEDKLTPHNRTAMIERATEAVHNYARWDEVAAYFDLVIPGTISDADPIPLPKPGTPRGGEGKDHLELKTYVANHPELFRSIGKFDLGSIEFRLDSGDEIDVLFQNDELALAVEVKTSTAPLGELTRGIFQCVKYRAVLRAMFTIDSKPTHVKVILVTPQQLTSEYEIACHRLGISYQKISNLS